jgi:hypothetical protein
VDTAHSSIYVNRLCLREELWIDSWVMTLCSLVYGFGRKYRLHLNGKTCFIPVRYFCLFLKLDQKAQLLGVLV